MSGAMVPFAVLSGVALAGAAVSFFALFRSNSLAAAAKRQTAAAQDRSGAALDELRQRLDTMTEELRVLQQQPAALAGMPLPKAGFNLNKRSQAVRLHRRGDSADQIAAALEVPRQEVELLIKVHRITMSSV